MLFTAIQHALCRSYATMQAVVPATVHYVVGMPDCPVLLRRGCACLFGAAGAADFEAADHAKEEAEAELVLTQEEMEK
jgi:hypothetical protein